MLGGGRGPRRPQPRRIPFATMSIFLLILACSLPNPVPDTAAIDTAAGAPTSLPGDPDPDPDPWFLPTYDANALPDRVPVVEITQSAAAMYRLDADPFHAADEAGSFTDGEGVVHDVWLN